MAWLGLRSNPSRKAGPRRGLPLLRKDSDAQFIRVAALLADPVEVARWRRQLTGAPRSRRAAAVVALGARLGPDAALALGGVLLADADPWVRLHAASALGFTACVPAARALLRALAVEADPAVRAEVLRGLGRAPRGTAGVVEALQQALVEDHPLGVAAALDALAQQEHSCVAQDAQRLARHTHAEVRRLAVGLLARHAPDHPALEHAVADKDAAVGRIAAQALRHRAAAHA